MSQLYSRAVLGLLATAFLGACSDNTNDITPVDVVDTPTFDFLTADESSVFAVANGCFSISVDSSNLFISTDAENNSASTTAGDSTTEGRSRFMFRAADLGQYLFYDQDGGYLVSDGTSLQRQTSLESDTNLVNDEVVIEDFKQSEGEWLLAATGDGAFTLQHILSGMFIGSDGAMTTADSAGSIGLLEETDCATFPELTLDASGEVAFTEFEDGDVFGFVDTHSHMFSNLAFGGGGSFHGAPFHPLGVEHALPSCELNHGEAGRKDFIGFSFSGGLGDFELLLPLFLQGELTEDVHVTDGYPDFTEWPSAAPFSSTHQMQYHKWIERAYLSGLRLVVQHVTTNQVLCQLAIGIGAQTQRLSCNDMITADRMIDEAYAMERYIDAQSGGPGEGWFRIVFSPEEARQQIRAGKMAVVLGIETSDLFDCYLVPLQGFSRCTEEDVVARLDEYYDKGIRVLFPVHKFDNDFSAGDGDRRIGDTGTFFHTGHFSNFIECPAELLTFPGGFDRGGVNFANLNMPRVEYDSPPPIDVSNFDSDPVRTILDNASLFGGDSLPGEYCQNHGLTELGEFLIVEMMKRGMVLEVDHFPRKSYKRAFEIMAEYDYPGAGTHGRNNNGELYALGGVSKANLGRCRNESTTATMDDGFQSRIQLIRDKGGYPAEGFGFDLNGFAGVPGPRFGDRAGCSDPQTDEGITYPFTSYAGDITLEQPAVGNRVLDFNTEGMVHLGLVAELIEDVRRDGVSDEELEPLFRSAEGYIRMWEKSESRGRAISQR
jgi:microsomal dipeptidase-like Zn-dependent dipeptidase